MKQDEFERLDKIVSGMEAKAKTKAEEEMFDAIRAGIGILERFVVAIERIAAQGEPNVMATEQAPYTAT